MCSLIAEYLTVLRIFLVETAEVSRIIFEKVLVNALESPRWSLTESLQKIYRGVNT